MYFELNITILGYNDISKRILCLILTFSKNIYIENLSCFVDFLKTLPLLFNPFCKQEE